MADVFISLVVTGAVGTVLTLVIYLAKNIIRKHFPSHWLYYMWAAVLVVMILPLRIQLPHFTDDGHTMGSSPAPGEVVFVASEPEYTGEAVLSETDDTFRDSDDADNIKAGNVRKYSIPGVMRFISYVWLICAALIFFYKVISYIVFYITVFKNSSKTDIPEIGKYTGRKIHTRICPTLSSPLMTGVFFPVLFLPDVGLSGERLEYVLLHETTHLKRFDILLKWFSMAVSCIHFYNPAVYLACKGLSEECEISCDALVVKSMDREQRREYVETILSLLMAGKAVRAPLTTGMTSNYNLLKTRFTLIKERKSAGKVILIFSTAISVIILFVTCVVSGIVGGFVPKVDPASQNPAEFDTNTGNNIDTRDIYVGIINAEDTSLMNVADGNGEIIMTIPTAVAEQFPAFKKAPGMTDLIIFCGKADDFLWAGVTTKGVMSKSHTNICTSSDGGKNWFVGTDGYIGKGIVDKIWFISEKEGYISYSGGGYGKGISKTRDGGVTWEHFMEHDYALPLSREDALKLLKHQLIFAYTSKYGHYTPISDDPRKNIDLSDIPGGYVGDEVWLPYVIENLEISGEDEDYYTVPVIWDFKIEKSTGSIFKFYDGHSKALMPFDPYSPDALAFAG